MLVEWGIITNVRTHRITVNCRSKIDCVRSAEGKGCGGGILARWLGNRQYSIQAFYDDSTQSPKIGDFVAIAVPAKRIVKLASIMYGIPLLLLVLFLVFQVTFFPGLSDLTVIAVAIMALFFGFKVANKLVEKANKRGLMLPSMLSKNAEIQIPISECKNRIEMS